MIEPRESDASENLVRQDETVEDAAILRLLDKPLSLDDLREATEQVAKPLGLAQEDVVRLLMFQLGEEVMALEAVEVHQVTRATSVHRIPHRSNRIVRGHCNLDGELMLCADLAKLLELGAGASDVNDASVDCARRRMIVLGDEQNRWVMEVDGVMGVVAVSRDLFRRPPVTVDAASVRFTKSLVPSDQGLAALLDVERVLSGFRAALR